METTLTSLVAAASMNSLPKYGDPYWAFPSGLYRIVALHAGIKENYLLRRMSKGTRKWFKKTPELAPGPFEEAFKLWFNYAWYNYSVKGTIRNIFIPFTMHFSESLVDPLRSLEAVKTCLDLILKDWQGLTMYLVKMIPPSFGQMVIKVFELKLDGYELLDLNMAVLADSLPMTRHFLPSTHEARLAQSLRLSLCTQSTKLIHVLAESKEAREIWIGDGFSDFGWFATSKAVEAFLTFQWFTPDSEFSSKAGQSGNSDLLQLCVASADPRLDPSGRVESAITLAARDGNIDCVEILLTDPRVLRSAIHFDYAICSSFEGVHYQTCTVSETQAIIKLLLRRGLGLDIYDPTSRTNSVFERIVIEGWKDQLDLVYADPEIRALLPPNAHTYHRLL